MELLVKSRQENKALSRTEMVCEASFDKAVPSRKELREAICAAAGTDPALLVVVSVEAGFGSKRAVVAAHAYKSKEALAVERKHLLVRDGLAQKEGKKKGEKTAPAKK
jgi:ribosomal protein S24E